MNEAYLVILTSRLKNTSIAVPAVCTLPYKVLRGLPNQTVTECVPFLVGRTPLDHCFLATHHHPRWRQSKLQLLVL